jgi:hypothetical protein
LRRSSSCRIADHNFATETVCVADQHWHLSWLIAVNRIFNNNDDNLPTLIVAQTDLDNDPTQEILPTKASLTINIATSRRLWHQKGKTDGNQSSTRNFLMMTLMIPITMGANYIEVGIITSYLSEEWLSTKGMDLYHESLCSYKGSVNIEVVSCGLMFL